MLETVVPRAPNAAVMLVGGRRKGQVKEHLSPIKYIPNLLKNLSILEYNII